jgi:hypothetical protein
MGKTTAMATGQGHSVHAFEHALKAKKTHKEAKALG